MPLDLVAPEPLNPRETRHRSLTRSNPPEDVNMLNTYCNNSHTLSPGYPDRLFQAVLAYAQSA